VDDATILLPDFEGGEQEAVTDFILPDHDQPVLLAQPLPAALTDENVSAANVSEVFKIGRTAVGTAHYSISSGKYQRPQSGHFV
jgi:hypothetical protein